MQVRRWLSIGLATVLVVSCAPAAAPAPPAAPAGSAAPAAINNDPTAILKYDGMQTRSLDPIVIGNACDVTILSAIFDTLIFLDSANTPKPGLAVSWTLPDPSTLELKLRDGVKFQDGTPFNAEAAKFNLDRARGDAASTIKSDLGSVTSVDVIDPLSIRIKMSPPSPASILAILAGRAGMMASPTAVKAAGSSAAFSKAPVGAGMYKISGEWRPTESASVRAWDGYWDKTAALLGGVDYRDIAASASMNALKSRDNDVSGFPTSPGILDTIRQDPKLIGLSNSTGGYRFFIINSSLAPFDNVKVRQALQHAIDREAIAKAQTGGIAEPAWSAFPKGNMAYNPELAGLYPYNPAKAKQLLSEAGYPNGLSFEAAIGRTSTSYVQTGELVQAQLKLAGFDMKLNLIEPALVVPSMYRGGANNHGTLQASPLGMFDTPDPDILVRNRYVANGPFNPGGVELPGLKVLADQAVAIVDPAKRAEIYKKVTRMIADAAVDGVPLWFEPAVMGFQNYVGGINNARVRCTDNVRGVYITKGKVPAPR